MWGDLVKELKKSKADVLPEGWQEATDTAGTKYYTNPTVGVSSYDKPDASYDVTIHLEDIVESPLPTGWTEYKDAGGRSYYANTSGATMYERPIAIGTSSSGARLSRNASKAQVAEVKRNGMNRVCCLIIIDSKRSVAESDRYFM